MSCSSIVEVDTHSADAWMSGLFPEDRSEIPDHLKGIYYMDGNTMPEELATLNMCKFDKKRRTVQGNPFRTPGWTYDPAPPNERKHTRWRGLIQMCWMACCNPGLMIRFDDDEFKAGALNLTLSPPCCPSWICCCCCHPGYCIEIPGSTAYGMRWEQMDEEGNLWRRYQGTDKANGYDLRKIFTKGQRLPAYEAQMMKEVPRVGYRFEPWW
jgi:hypothetical protein